jgi:hypothetical protein
MTVSPTNFQFKSRQQSKTDFQKRTQNYLHRLGRFNIVRQAYSAIQSQSQKFDSINHIKRLKLEKQTIFSQINVDRCVAEVQKTAVYQGLQLPANIVNQIYQFAANTPCTEPKFPGNFYAEDVINGKLNSQGRHVMRGLVSNADQCQAIDKIISDPLLIEIVRKYLKYYPTLITKHLTWSFASELPESEIQKIYPPTNFHYDVAGYNFMTISFYLTDVDLNSGPHVMIKHSHHSKPLQMLLGSNIHTDSTIFNHYGSDNQIYITGKKGFGFVQDPSCIHKLNPPVTGDRLILQIRYS